MRHFETPRQTWTRTLTWIACTLGPLLLVGFLVSGNTGAMVVILLFVVAPIALIALLVFALVRASSTSRPPVTARQALPPGWYRDQYGVERWFDGQQFTQVTR